MAAHREKVEKAGLHVDRVLAGLDGREKAFFEGNFVAQYHILHGTVTWLERIVQADLAARQGRPGDLLRHARAAKSAVEEIRAAQRLASRGKWQGWYDVDWLMDVKLMEQQTGQLVDKAAAGAARKPAGAE